MRIFIFLLAFSNLAFGISINLKEKILLDPKNNILQYNTGIALLDDGSVLFCDGRAGDFKIFDRKGSLFKTFGRKGEGPDEFVSNYLLGYHDGKAIIMNRGKLKLAIYRITNNLEFIAEQGFGLFAFDAAIANDNLVLTRLPEYDPNQTLYSLFALHLKTKKMSYLIQTKLSFGEKPIELKLDQTSQRQDVVDLGFNSNCDIQNRLSYFVWQGNWQVMKLEMNTNKLTRFGKRPENYIQPYSSKELKQAFRTGNYKKVDQLYQKFSWMVDVIAWKEFILAFYVTFENKTKYWQTYLQIYNSKEELVLEKKLEGLHSLERFVSIHMNKKNGQFIGLAHFLDSAGDDQYQILKFEINRLILIFN
jgi:hypothetical protein